MKIFSSSQMKSHGYLVGLPKNTVLDLGLKVSALLQAGRLH